MRILVCGLPGSGKTTLAKALREELGCLHVNADEVRKRFNDWDFSQDGRLRQAYRMKLLSMKACLSVSDFIAPTEKIRDIFSADFTIWMDTIKSSKYKDTDAVFETPKYDIKITSFDYSIKNIIKEINV